MSMISLMVALVATQEPPKPTNLCGGTGEKLDPLAYDGWSGQCPGCDACKDAEPPPEPEPDPIGPPGWERAAYAEPWPPNLYAPVKGRILKQAKGPNRAADRARGIYGKRGKR